MATMDSLHLRALPVELLLSIFKYTAKSDLVALSYVCKVFRHVAEPLLYKDIDLQWNNTWIFNLPPHHSLFLTLLRRPELGPQVRTLRLRPNSSREPWDGMPPVTGIHLELARKRFHDVGLPDTDSLTRRLQLGGNQSLNVTLLCLLCASPHLETLELNVRFMEDSQDFSSLLAALFRTDPYQPCSSLQAWKHIELFINNFSGGHECQFCDFQWLFYLPAVETIRSAAFESCSPFRWPTTVPIAPTVTDLRLVRSHIKEESIEILLSAVPNLKIFEFDIFCATYCNLLHSNHLDCAKLGNSLQRAKGSLETLILSVEFHSYQDDVTDGRLNLWGPLGILGPLRDFLKLRTLRAPLAILLGWTFCPDVTLASLLPNDLFRFCCTDDMSRWQCWGWTNDSILQKFEEYLDDETSLELQYLEMFKLRHGDKQIELETMCENAGIFYDEVGHD